MKKILVVDDIEEYLESIEMMLSDEYETVKARNLREAINLLKKEKVAGAIIDIRLDESDPENKDGLQLVKWMRENTPDIPVFVMSAYKEFDYAVEALNLGAKYFFKKPLNPGEVLEVIKGIVK